jgi:peroxiredoxin
MKTFLTNPMLAPRIEEISLKLTSCSSDGGTASLALSSLAGRVVVLLVFGVDCGTCKHLANAASSLQSEFAGRVQFIGLCIQSGCEERLERFRAESGTEMPLGHCSTRQLCPALHIPPATWLFYPTLILIDSRQRMRGYVVGGDSFFKDCVANLRETLEALQSEQMETPELEALEKVEAGA